MADDLREVFNRIAPSWYNYRHWTIFRHELETLAKEWRSGTLLNLGCGHGADSLPFSHSFDLYGVDFSGEMLKLARKYAEKFNFQPNLAVADLCSLPFIDDSFDYVISVAAFHHLEAKNQLTALHELKRVLKPGGKAFITVWNRWQPRFWFSRKEVSVPWKIKGKTLSRYYYLFSKTELTGLVLKSGLKIERVFAESSYRFPIEYFSRNICILARKEIKEN